MARFVALLLLVPCLVSAAQVTPAQKVLSMLKEMQTKAVEAGETERKIFAEYESWVEDERIKKDQEIKTGTRKATKLAAVIEKANSDTKTLAFAIAELDEEMTTMETQKKEANTQRAEENAEYRKLRAEYTESGDAVAMAIAQLKNANVDVAQSMLQMQHMAGKHKGMRHVLAALLQMEEASKAPEIAGPPEASAYQFNAGGLIDMLETLQDKFAKQLAETEDTETNAAHAFALQNQHLADLLQESKSDREEKAAMKAQLSGQASAASAELADTTGDTEEDKKELSDVNVGNREKSDLFAANQKVRKEELEALGKAIEIISSPEVTGLLQQPVNFLQQGSRAASTRAHALKSLQSKAGFRSSSVLANLAAQVADRSNPFGAIKKSISDMLAKLKKEHAAEGSHKAWCDGEMKKNKMKREKRTSKGKALRAEVEGLSSAIQAQASTIAELSKEQAELSSGLRTATELRLKEKSKNRATITDSKSGRAAVNKAIAVLKKFYSSQSLAQVGEQAPYGGQGSSSTGVIGMLEIMETDYARLETETTAAEAVAARTYDKFAADAKENTQKKAAHETKLSLKKDQTEFKLQNTRKSQAGVGEELAKANQYFEDLKPNCITVKVSYAERKARRDEELASLRETYEQLSPK